jgi:NAD(P)-dependent dehydrogenase (short-subunit alcohol dehydrogenase family)
VKKIVIILSISSDIGLHLAHSYLKQGCRVIGTYRSKQNLKSLEGVKDCSLIQCDVSKKADIIRLGQMVRKLRAPWDTFISCVGHPLPVMPFFESDFEEWSSSVYVNSIAQLHAVHALYPLRNKKHANVVFFAGGGMNGTVVNFSAYTISKIMLTKMCEFLDAENKDLNVFIVGPGWTKTKIHQTILGDKRTSGRKVKETKEFLKAKEGTSLDDIFECIDWLCQSGKALASGRNFSVVYDPWRTQTRSKLVKALKSDKDMYKIRRHGNSFLQ